MLDGIVPSAVEAAVAKYRASVVAGYLDGQWPDFYPLAQATPQLRHVSIATRPKTTRVLVYDVEAGNMSPAEAVGAVVGDRASGIIAPCCYVEYANWNALRNAFASNRIAEPLYWVGLWDGNPQIMPDAFAKQYANTLSFDISSVPDYWPGLDPEPISSVSTVEDDEMQQIDALTFHPGEYAYGINPKNAYSEVAFSCDGYGGQASLRVVVWDAGGDLVHEITVGGPENTEPVHQTVVKFPNPTSAYMVTVRRLDPLGFPVAVVFR